MRQRNWYVVGVDTVGATAFQSMRTVSYGATSFGSGMRLVPQLVLSCFACDPRAYLSTDRHRVKPVLVMKSVAVKLCPALTVSWLGDPGGMVCPLDRKSTRLNSSHSQ